MTDDQRPSSTNASSDETQPATSRRGGKRASAPIVTGEAKETSRFSLDLEKPKHRALKFFAFEHETEQSVVGRILVDLLLEDDDVKELVRGRLEPSS